MIPYSMNPMGIDSYDDLYWLRKIRDANPTSQLPSLWLDTEDPYTQWEGVMWDGIKVARLSINSKSISSLPNVNKLTSLEYLDCYSNQLTTLDVTGLILLRILGCNDNQLNTLVVSGLTSLQELYCNDNQLTSIPTLTSKENINAYDFTYNNFTITELDRFRALGFDCESVLLPQNP